MKKKLVILVLAASMGMGLTACSFGNADGQPSTKIQLNGESAGASENPGSSENSEAEEAPAVSIGKDSSFEEKWNYIPEYLTKIEYGACDESKKPVNLAGEDKKSILDAISEDEEGLTYYKSFGALDVCENDENIPGGYRDAVDYTLSVLGNPSAGYVTNFDPYKDYYDEDDDPVKMVTLVYEYSDYVLAFYYMDMHYASEWEDVKDTAFLQTIYVMNKEAYDAKFKEDVLTMGSGKYVDMLGSFGSLEGYVPTEVTE